MILVGKKWVYILQEKSKAFTTFNMVLVEKEMGSLIKVLHIDHGREYISQEFANFYNLLQLTRLNKTVFMKKRIA